MRNDIKDVPLSESNVSLKLAEIQKRCSELLHDAEALSELTLEDELPVVADDGSDPYNHPASETPTRPDLPAPASRSRVEPASA